MADFMIRFLLCNILLCGIIGILLLIKHILKTSLSSQMQYNLWFLLPKQKLSQTRHLIQILQTPKLDGRFYPFRKQRNSTYNWLSVTCTLDIGYHHHTDISNPVCLAPAYFEKLCVASSKSKDSKIISVLPKRHKYYKKHPNIQHRLSKISCH